MNKEKVDELLRIFELVSNFGQIEVQKRWGSHFDAYWTIILYDPFECFYSEVRKAKDLLIKHRFNIERVRLKEGKIE